MARPMATYVAKQGTARARRAAVSGSDPILVAKITAPAVPDWALERPRIAHLIARGTRWCPLTVVTGPPGAGKTMALALWAAAEPGPVAWVSLEEYDNRPGAFWSYVIAALRQAGVAVPRAVADRGRAGDHAFLLRLASALADQDPPVRLVLDDFHLLDQQKVRSGLDFVLRNTGPGLRLVICSRADPLLPLHRYRLAGELAEIRAADLAFTSAEAGELLAQHGSPLSAASVDCLTRRTEGWAAGIRLAALSVDAHPDPDQFVKELTAEDSALTSYLVEEVLNAQPPEVREVLLATSIMDHVSPGAAGELTGSSQAGRILADLAHTNAFVQPVGGGWYRYHTMFAEVLRLKLRHEHPGRVTELHRRAARWYQRGGALTSAVRHAARAGDWPLAAGIVVDGLAVGDIIEPGPAPSLAGEFAGMPPPRAGDQPQLYLVGAAVALAMDTPQASAAALGVAEDLLQQLPADQQVASWLAATMIRLAAARRTGNLSAVAAAAARVKALTAQIPAGQLAEHPDRRARLLSACGTVELWSGCLDEAARVLSAAVAAVDTQDADDEQAGWLGQLALVEALRGRLSRAADLAAQATAAPGPGGDDGHDLRPNTAALLALAWAHLEHNQLAEAGGLLKQVNAALSMSPDKLLGALACLVAARGCLAEGHTAAAAQYLAKARAGWSVPAWLAQRLSLSRARPADGPQRQAVPAQRPAPLPAGRQAPRAAGPARHPAARAQHPAARAQHPAGPAQNPAPLVVEPLTEREQEVLRYLSQMLSTAEVASEMYISTNTVKSHLKSAFRKLGAAHRGEAVRRARQLQLI
jgi:LuxR family transcriptional regulator, maltose regulon positive regulatory protein